MKILITGKNSYIGKSFYNWVKKNSKNIEIDFVSIRNDEYKKLDFSKYTSIIHLAALVHLNENKQHLSDYIKVNYFKSKELINKAIEFKVNQFIFMSTMAIFGKTGKIDEKTPINPKTKYGISKKMAEDFIISKKDEIKVSILRSPMIYGKNAPGNSSLIEKISKIIPFFPSFKNKRSFVEINTLCEILFKIIEEKPIGIIHPSPRIMSTYDLFSYYRNLKLSIKVPFFNPFIRFILKFPIVNKIFGDLYYDFDSIILKF